MSWKCPCCGYEANGDDSRLCAGGCGYVRLPRIVVLTSNSTGKQITLSVETTVGKYLLRSFAGDEAVYASEPQFAIYKDTALASWAIKHLEGAKNPTFCDGVCILTAPAPLHDGSVVSIGSERMKLSIRLED
jgi:hypothetical protein